MLADFEIRDALNWGEIIIYPYPADMHFQPASVDVHLGNRFGRLKIGLNPQHLTDPSNIEYVETSSYLLGPHEFVLAQLKQKLTLSDSIVARIEGKSSIGRKGVAIHVTAGFVDPGWDGYLTLEIVNQSNQTYFLCAGDPIGQLAFDKISPVHRPYGDPSLGSHYQGSASVRGS